jgi:hypothetical protein
MISRRGRAPKGDCGCPTEARQVEARNGRRVCLAMTERGPRFVARTCVPTEVGLAASDGHAADAAVDAPKEVSSNAAAGGASGAAGETPSPDAIGDLLASS